MTPAESDSGMPELVGDGDVAIVTGPGSFVIAPGARARGLKCLICRQAMGGGLALMVGAAALHPADCACEGIAADMWLAHAIHWPIAVGDLHSAVSRALETSGS